MKRDKRAPLTRPTATTGENTINELDDLVGTANSQITNNTNIAGLTLKVVEDSYQDQVDRNLDRHQGESLLPILDSSTDDLRDSGDTTTIVGIATSNSISNRLVAFVPKINVKQSQKNLNSVHDNKASVKMGKKMPLYGNNNLQSGDDLEANEKTVNPVNCWPKCKWIFLILMGIALILTILVFALYPTTLNNGDKCSQDNPPFQQAKYNLFSTKTLYTSALHYLGRTSPTLKALSTSVATDSLSSAIQQPFIYDTSAINVPNIFSPQDKHETLESLNERLTNPSLGCKLKQLYFIGRHAARLPSTYILEQINKTIEALKTRIGLTTYQTEFSTQEQSPPTAFVDSTGNAANKSNQVCLDPYTQFKQWTNFASPDQGNFLISSGVEESALIAQRLKSIYPDMFDANLTKITFATTEEERTAQTAITFMRQIENFDPVKFGLDVCQSEISPSAVTSNGSIIMENECSQKIAKTFGQNKLSFHKKCDQLSKASIDNNLNFDISNRTRFITESVSKNLKISKEEDKLTPTETKAIYDACRYESAMKGLPSIWCSLFSRDDLQFYEYLSDIEDFFSNAYGDEYQYRSACPVTLDILREFNKESSKSSPEAKFYFTHSDVIQKLIAASINLAGDPEYEPKRVLQNLENRFVPKNRQWQTSLFTPFSANLAFTLYECPSSPLKSASNSYKEFNVRESNMYVVASLNEQPIILEGCVENVCSMSELMFSGRIFTEKKCILEEICKKKYLLT